MAHGTSILDPCEIEDETTALEPVHPSGDRREES
jgi:hypothetical protein